MVDVSYGNYGCGSWNHAYTYASETTKVMIRLIGLNLCLDGVLNLIIVVNTVKTDRKLRG